MPWEDVISIDKLDYIIGNPPFSGARLMSRQNKQDLKQALGSDWPGKIGDLDFVCGWFKKAHDIMRQAPHVKTAFVATNSICQGTSITNLWAPLIQGGADIFFAHRSFLWSSEALAQAHVFCVIVGFAHKACPANTPKLIYDGNEVRPAQHINAYLLDAADAFIEERQTPLCAVPSGRMGNQPIDGGNYLFTPEQKEAFLKLEPQAAPYFKRWYGSEELLKGKVRYCLYLGQCSVNDLKQMPETVKRVEAVRQFRLQSKSAPTRKLAQTPTVFNVTNIPQSPFLVIPEVSSSRRDYIPIAFMTSKDGLCSNLLKLFPNSTLYHLSVLSSSIHMTWVKTVCGRLKMDYRYSTELVYNTFPWPQDVSPQLQQKMEASAQSILKARAQAKETKLAQLYDPSKMPKTLRQAHRDNDLLVMKAYGFEPSWTQDQIFAALYQLYQHLGAQYTPIKQGK